MQNWQNWALNLIVEVEDMNQEDYQLYSKNLGDIKKTGVQPIKKQITTTKSENTQEKVTDALKKIFEAEEIEIARSLQGRERTNHPKTKLILALYEIQKADKDDFNTLINYIKHAK